MAQRARLITPQGKKIDLPPDIYRQVRQLLTARSRARTTEIIRTTYGKYAGGTSRTQAPLAEHRLERAREEAKLKRLQGHLDRERRGTDETREKGAKLSRF